MKQPTFIDHVAAGTFDWLIYICTFAVVGLLWWLL